MGRLRTTGCTSKHVPGEPCHACDAWRARLSRLRRRDQKAREQKQHEQHTASRRAKGSTALTEQEADAEEHRSDEEKARAALDKAAAQHRAQLIRAKMYVPAYHKRGTILPPDACERCGIGERLTPWSKSTPLVFWHPNPLKKREVAWLCVPCRRHIRATREPLTLTWVWPGGLPIRPRGRLHRIEPDRTNVAIDPAWCASAVAATEGVASSLPGLAAELFLHAFLTAAGPENVEVLYGEGVQAGATWTP